MDKLGKLLNKYNNQYLYKDKTNIALVRQYEEELLRQGLFFKINSDEDYIKFEVIKTSYDNMRKIQNEFFDLIKEIGEVWQVISYQERHFLLYQKLTPFMDTLKNFYVDDKRYFIAYFGDLINAYYDHDMLMFENEAYRKYLYDFKKIISPIDKYGYLPLKSNFTQAKYVMGDNENYILYNKKINRFYHYGKSKQSYGFSRDINDDQVFDISKFLYHQDKEGLLEYLITHKLAGKRLLKKLLKMQRKLSK